MEDVYPHHPYPPPNWLRYSESNRTLCAQAMEIIVFPRNRRKRGYCDIFCGGVMSTAYINLRSKTDKILLAHFKIKKLCVILCSRKR